MINNWSPKSRLVAAFVAAPLAAPALFSIPSFVMGVRTSNWGLALVSLIVAGSITYLNTLVVAVPVWLILGRNRLIRNHWPLTLGGSLSGMITGALVTRSFPILSMLIGSVAGFLSALLFWAIALRETRTLVSEQESAGM